MQQGERNTVNSIDTDTTPTVPGEASSSVDDAQVIDKTLPNLPNLPNLPHSQRLKGRLIQAVESTRGLVVEQPVQSLLIAATVGVLLGTVLTTFALASATSRYESRGRG